MAFEVELRFYQVLYAAYSLSWTRQLVPLSNGTNTMLILVFFADARTSQRNGGVVITLYSEVEYELRYGNADVLLDLELQWLDVCPT